MIVARPGRENDGVPTRASMSAPRARRELSVGIRRDASRRSPSIRRIVTLDDSGGPVSTGALANRNPGSKCRTHCHIAFAAASDVLSRTKRAPAIFVWVNVCGLFIVRARRSLSGASGGDRLQVRCRLFHSAERTVGAETNPDQQMDPIHMLELKTRKQNFERAPNPSFSTVE